VRNRDVSALTDVGTGNVFADLGIPNPDLALAKAQLVQRIRALIGERKLTPARAAKLLGLDDARFSALLRGRVTTYSIDRLFRFLNALGQQVEISIRSSGVPTLTGERHGIRVTD